MYKHTEYQDVTLKKNSFGHITTFNIFSLNKRELSNQDGLQATQIYYQAKLQNHFQRCIKKLKSSMIKYSLKKSLPGLTYCNIFYVATLRKLISKRLILAVFRAKTRELIYFKNTDLDPHNSTFTSSFKGH